MAEYNFTIENKTNTGYDQLYPATKGEQVDVSEIATDLGLSGTVNVNDALKAAYEHGGGSSLYDDEIDTLPHLVAFGIEHVTGHIVAYVRLYVLIHAYLGY